MLHIPRAYAFAEENTEDHNEGKQYYPKRVVCGVKALGYSFGFGIYDMTLFVGGILFLMFFILKEYF
jgi:hypothetical protein